MTVIENDNIVFCDIDDTLVVWTPSGYDFMFCPYTGDLLHFRAHAGNIRLLKEKKARGATVAVWSAGGWKHAEAVINALQLNAYVDIILSKPSCVIDDLPCSVWMPDSLCVPETYKVKEAV